MATFKRQNWDTLMSSYSVQWDHKDKGKKESYKVLFSLKNLLERKTNIHWHIIYLQKYISERIIPFGLRIKLFPHFNNPTLDFKNKWEETLTNCSLNVKSLLIGAHRAELGTIDNKLQQLNVSLITFNTLTGFSDKGKQISENLAKSRK